MRSAALVFLVLTACSGATTPAAQSGLLTGVGRVKTFLAEVIDDAKDIEGGGGGGSGGGYSGSLLGGQRRGHWTNTFDGYLVTKRDVKTVTKLLVDEIESVADTCGLKLVPTENSTKTGHGGARAVRAFRYDSANHFGTVFLMVRDVKINGQAKLEIMLHLVEVFVDR